MVATMVRQRKRLKIHLLKHPKKIIQITKFGPENKLFKTSYLEFILVWDFQAGSLIANKNLQTYNTDFLKKSYLIL